MFCSDVVDAPAMVFHADDIRLVFVHAHQLIVGNEIHVGVKNHPACQFRQRGDAGHANQIIRLRHHQAGTFRAVGPFQGPQRRRAIGRLLVKIKMRRAGHGVR